MSERLSKIKNKRQFGSFLMVCVLVAASLVTIIPLTAPNVKAQIYHLASTGLEDNILPYDTDLIAGQITWDGAEPHIINDMFGSYIVESGYRLIIPPTASVTFELTGTRIDVMDGGTLITQDDLNPLTTSTFTKATGWEGINFRPGSQGRIQDCTFDNSLLGVVFNNESVVMSPGIRNSYFINYAATGLTLDGAVGDTNGENLMFDVLSAPSGTGLTLINGSFNVTGMSVFNSHGTNEPAVYVSNGSLVLDGSSFDGDSQPGNCVYIDEKSNGTILNSIYFYGGSVGEHYVRVDGSSPLIENCTFITSGGELSVLATDDANEVPAAPVVRQPSALTPGFFDFSFDNSTIDATENSTIALEWYLNVYVDDPDGNPITNVPVTVVDRLGNPSTPPTKKTNITTGWAKWFTIRELLATGAGIIHYNPFNISAVNVTETGYVDPEPTLNMSNEVSLTVPFTTLTNTIPTVSITPLTGAYSGMISIDYILSDPDFWDDGSLSVQIIFSTDGMGWRPCTQGGGDPTTLLFNNTAYNFIWDTSTDLPDEYFPTVWIQIIPYDKAGPGTLSQTGSFVVDNKAPIFLSGPFTTPSNITALIEWTVNESADAVVWWGLWVNGDETDLTTETAGTIGSTDQNVTLTGLLHGRKYTFAINSTDPYGNKRTSAPTVVVFSTQVHIPLYTGWNMISLPIIIPDSRVDVVFASLTGQYDIIQVYDAFDTADPWKQYIPGKLLGNDLTDIFPDLGIWIHMLNDVVFVPDQMIPDPSEPDPSAYLQFGWNLAGYPSATTTPIDTALAGISYDMVQTFDAASGNYYSYDGTSGDLAVMETGRGYWIHCIAPLGQMWTIPYI